MSSPLGSTVLIGAWSFGTGWMMTPGPPPVCWPTGHTGGTPAASPGPALTPKTINRIVRGRITSVFIPPKKPSGKKVEFA